MTRETPRLIVHLLHRPPDYAVEHLLEQIDSGIQVTMDPEPPPGNTQLLVGGRPSEEQLAACPVLKTLVIPYAGVPDTTLALIRETFPQIALHNLHHNAVAAAELAIALMLAAAKTIVPADRKFRDGDWRTRYDGAPTLLLEGKTLLLIGLGAIGRRVAQVCRALGMRVVAVRRRATLAAPDGIEIRPTERLRESLPEADVVCIAAALTPETTGLIGRDELRLLPSHAVLVNVARGPIVDEAALYEALRTGRIGAAGIDTWYHYPQSEAERASTHPSRFSFQELDNVVMSPHRGGAFRTEELERIRMGHLARSINAASRGEPIPHRVQLDAGY